MYKYTFFLLIVPLLAVSSVKNKINNNKIECFENKDNFFTCISVKIISSLDRATNSAHVKVADGVTFVKDISSLDERNGKSFKSEAEIFNELLTNSSDKTLQLATMFLNSASSFFKTHSLKINIPEASLSRTFLEGRAKIKKMIFPFIATAGIKILALIPILFGGLSLLIMKALLMGKIALIIAGILAFQRLYSNSASSIGSSFGGISGNLFNKNPPISWYDGNQGWSSVTSNQGQGLYRSFSNNIDANTLAYAGQVSTTKELNKIS